MPRPPKTQPAPVDPLADLREEETPGAPPAPPEGAEEQEPDVVQIRPMVTAEVMDEMVSEAVAAFHADPTSQGFIHGGGQCGCRYIARVALQAAVPVMTPEDQELALELSGEEGRNDG